MCEGIYSHFTTEKTQQVSLETIKQLPDPTTTSYKGIAKILLIPVIFFALYKITCFFYASLGKSLATTPDVGFTLKQDPLTSEEKEELLQAVKTLEKRYLTESEKMNAKEIIIKFAKQGSVDAICFMSGIDKRLGAYESQDISIHPDYLKDYVEKGKMVVLDVSAEANFYTELACVFDLIDNPKARDILLKKAAVLCNPQTVVKIAAAYMVTTYRKDDPLLAKLAEIESTNDLYECVKSDRGHLKIFHTNEQRAGIAYYHLARYDTLHGNTNKAFEMYLIAAPNHFISALQVAKVYDISKNDAFADHYVTAAKLLKPELDSWNDWLVFLPNISKLDEVIIGCAKAITTYSKPDQSDKKSEAEALKTHLETFQKEYLEQMQKKSNKKTN